MQKIFSRKFLVTLVTLISALLGEDVDPVQLGVLAGVSIAYVIAEAFVDHRRLTHIAEAAKRGIDLAQKNLAIFLSVGLGAVALTGCAHGHGGRVAIDIGGHSLRTTDMIARDEYRRIETRCDASATSLDEWKECMRPGTRLEEALRGMRDYLYSAEAALDAAGSDGFNHIAPCVARAAAKLVEAFEATGLHPPGELAALERAFAGYGTACTDPEAGS